MIDVEKTVYTRIHDKVKAQYPKSKVTDTYPKLNSDFPCVYVEMSDNALNAEDTTDEHEYSAPMFTVEIFSNLVNGAKGQAKAIAAIVDNTLFSLNFERTSMTPVPNMGDATIYRLVLRYRGMSDGTYFFRR